MDQAKRAGRLRLAAVLGLGAPVIGGAVVGALRLARRAAAPAKPGRLRLSPLQCVGRTVVAVASDPIEVWTRVATELREWPERRRPIRPYAADRDWEAQLRIRLGGPSPFSAGDEAAAVWQDALVRIARRGVAPGPMSFLGCNDGDLALARAVWRLARGLKARRVVETGVAHGVTSRLVLEALDRNGGGRLWSIDLPPILHPELRGEIGAAVDFGLRGNWTYVEGSSRRRLPRVLKEAAPLDLFIHDSRHTTGNVLFELHLAWAALRPGGAVVVDDVDTNNGFHQFCEATPHARAWVCEAEPVRPDDRRANRKGYFGIVMKAGSPDQVSVT
jgi:hypothetical protein